MNKKFWATALTLSGTIIGAGILGLPYVFAQSGFFIGAFWLIVLGAIMIFTNLCLGEISLRTKKNHQLTGYAELYLGKKAKTFMLIAMLIGVYSALIAYLIGEGQSLSLIITGSSKNAFLFSVGFWLIMTLLLQEGLRELKKVESFGSIGVMLLIVAIFLIFIPSIKIQNIQYINPSKFFLPFGIILFALLGFTAIPELRREIKGSEKLFKKAIILGALIPVFAYLIFSFTFVGSFGKNVNEIATLSSGPIINLLGIFTMLTSYFVLSFAIKDLFVFDYQKKTLAFIFSSIIPIVLFIAVSFLGLADFINILSIGGVLSGGLTGILILLINKKAKIKGKRKPELVVPLNWGIIGIIIIIFLFGMFQKAF